MSQTTQNNGKFPPKTFAGDVSDFARNVAGLAELQLELLRADSTNCARKALLPAVAGIGAITSTIACLPLFLMALASGLIAAGLVAWAAYLLAGLVGLLGCATLGYFCLRKVRIGLREFESSKTEFVENVAWVKGVVTGEARHR